MLAGMEPIEELMRQSGQYGPRVEVAEDADVQTRFIAFIGRDPHWTPDPSAVRPAGPGPDTQPDPRGRT
jgi:hypothetical protein